MPIYEYQCRSCGHRTEALQRMSDPPLTECQECSGELKKLISAPSFQFKGSGWYVTDYAKKGGEGSKESAGESDSKAGDSSASSSGSSEGSSASSATKGKDSKAEAPSATAGKGGAKD